MTARRKDDGTLEVINAGLGSNTFRIFVTVLLLSMHPLGRSVLERAGFEFPKSEIQETAFQQVAGIRTDVLTIKNGLNNVHAEVEDVKHDVESLKVHSAITQAKLDKLVK